MLTFLTRVPFNTTTDTALLVLSHFMTFTGALCTPRRKDGGVYGRMNRSAKRGLPHNGALLSHEAGGNSDTCHNVDEL